MKYRLLFSVSSVQTVINKLDHRWRLPPLLVMLLVSSTYNRTDTFNRLSEAKENRIRVSLASVFLAFPNLGAFGSFS